MPLREIRIRHPFSSGLRGSHTQGFLVEKCLSETSEIPNTTLSFYERKYENDILLTAQIFVSKKTFLRLRCTAQEDTAASVLKFEPGRRYGKDLAYNVQL